MFRCDICKKSEAEKQNKIVVETRDRVYHYYIVNFRDAFGRQKKKYTEDITFAQKQDVKIKKEFETKGREIVKEIAICSLCLKKEKSNG